MMAEFDYLPAVCNESYRVVVLRKHVEIGKGQLRLFEEYRYSSTSPTIASCRPEKWSSRRMTAAVNRVRW
jgi:hypothetical protein